MAGSRSLLSASRRFVGMTSQMPTPSPTRHSAYTPIRLPARPPIRLSAYLPIPQNQTAPREGGGVDLAIGSAQLKMYRRPSWIR